MAVEEQVWPILLGVLYLVFHLNQEGPVVYLVSCSIGVEVDRLIKALADSSIHSD